MTFRRIFSGCRHQTVQPAYLLTTFIAFPALFLSFTLEIKAQAQVPPDKPSVRERILEKAKKRVPAGSANWFTRLDADRDGSVSRVEVEMAVRRRFELIDKNRNRLIERNEFSVSPASLPATGPKFETMDTDRNGVLSFAEFSAPVLWRFLRLDIDDDGRISREEAARYLVTPTARALPPIAGTCYEIDGRLVFASPELAETYERVGKRQTECAWRPGAALAR